MYWNQGINLLCNVVAESLGCANSDSVSVSRDERDREGERTRARER
jgi:hypothetical protein